MYVRNILVLWVTGKISFQTVCHAIAARPPIVAGKRNAYVVD